MRHLNKGIPERKDQSGTISPRTFWRRTNLGHLIQNMSEKNQSGAILHKKFTERVQTGDFSLRTFQRMPSQSLHNQNHPREGPILSRLTQNVPQKALIRPQLIRKEPAELQELWSAFFILHSQTSISNGLSVFIFFSSKRQN